MITMYDSDIDMLEVGEEGYKTVGKNVSDALTLFYTEDGDLVGFLLDNASENFRELDLVPRRMQLAGLVRLARGLLGCSQKELAEILDIGHRSVQRLEAGEGNPTLDSLQALVEAAPAKIDFSVLLVKQRQAQI